MGQEFRAPTTDELTSGVTVANEMCCTEEIDFECLCCMDFSVPLAKCAPGQTGFCLSRCGAVDLDAANEPPGSPLSMEDDATMPSPYHPNPHAAVAQAPSVVMVCTKESGVGAMAAQQSGDSPVQLPMECIPREFTVGEIQGTQPDLQTGAQLTPGQVILDERIAFLQMNGMEPADVPTCTKTYAEKGGNGMCPMGTPKANQMPNSAGAAALGTPPGAYVSEAEQPAADAAFVRKESENKKSRVHGRTFSDLAALTESEIETVLGHSRKIAFVLNGQVERFVVEKVNTGSSLLLTGHGKQVSVSGKKVVFSDGDRTEEVDPLVTVLTVNARSRMGRRAGGGVVTTGGFTVGASSNTSGND